MGYLSRVPTARSRSRPSDSKRAASRLPVSRGPAANRTAPGPAVQRAPPGLYRAMRIRPRAVVVNLVARVLPALRRARARAAVAFEATVDPGEVSFLDTRELA